MPCALNDVTKSLTGKMPEEPEFFMCLFCVLRCGVSYNRRTCPCEGISVRSDARLQKNNLVQDVSNLICFILGAHLP